VHTTYQPTPHASFPWHEKCRNLRGRGLVSASTEAQKQVTIANLSTAGAKQAKPTTQPAVSGRRQARRLTRSGRVLCETKERKEDCAGGYETSGPR